MKISEITEIDVVTFLRLENGDYDTTEISAIMAAAKNYIVSYTGIPATSEDADAETLDSHEDFYIAYMVLCREMYDNRTMTVENSNANRVIDCILGMHSRNLL